GGTFAENEGAAGHEFTIICLMAISTCRAYGVLRALANVTFRHRSAVGSELRVRSLFSCSRASFDLRTNVRENGCAASLCLGIGSEVHSGHPITANGTCSSVHADRQALLPFGG